jgi:hypothetical protein
VVLLPQGLSPSTAKPPTLRTICFRSRKGVTLLKRSGSSFALALAVALGLAACGNSNQGLPNIASTSKLSEQNTITSSSYIRQDDPCNGGSDTVCGTTGGGSGNSGRNTSTPGNKFHQDDPCAGGGDTVCSTGGGGGGNSGGSGGGNPSGDDAPGAGGGGVCYVATRGNVHIDCGGGGGGGSRVGYPGHAALYGDQCSAGSLTIGQEIPGYGDPAHEASGTVTVSTQSGGNTIVLGYVYPTLGGSAYFVPVGASINVFIFGLTVTSSSYVGTNAQAGSATAIYNAISKYLKGVPSLNSVNCYPGGNWNGTYPA